MPPMPYPPPVTRGERRRTRPEDARFLCGRRFQESGPLRSQISASTSSSLAARAALP
jgi:hypothetical protein